MSTLKLYSVEASILRQKLAGFRTTNVAGLILARDRYSATARMHEDMDLRPGETLEKMEIREVKGPFVDGQFLMMKEVF